MSEGPKLICVTGPDGAGKTTQITRLAERLERGAGLKVAPVTIWDLLLAPQAREHVPFKDPAQVDRYLKLLTPVSRALFLFHCFYQALEMARAREPEVLLVNAYWYKYYATEVAHGGDPALLRPLTTVFPEPVMTFYLRVEPTEALRRKALRSGYETGFDADRSDQAFLAFQERSNAVLDELAAELGWHHLDGTESAEATTQLIVERITGGS